MQMISNIFCFVVDIFDLVHYQKKCIINRGVQYRIVLVVNILEFLKLIFFALLLLYLT